MAENPRRANPHRRSSRAVPEEAWQPPRTHDEFILRFMDDPHMTLLPAQLEYVREMIRGENHFVRMSGGRGGGKTTVRRAVLRMIFEAEQHDNPSLRMPAWLR